jgi:hypothetical protein
MDSLQETWHSLNTCLISARQREKNLKRKACYTFSKALRTLAVLVYILSSYDARLAVHVLRTRGRKTDTSDEDYWARVVEDWFLATSHDQLLEMLNPVTAEGEKLYKRAEDIVNQAGLASWVRCENAEKGLAPHTEEILIRRQEWENRAAVDCGDCRGDRSNMGLSANRSWARRWRQQWGVGIDCIPAKEPLTADEIWSKVVFSRLSRC